MVKKTQSSGLLSKVAGFFRDRTDVPTEIADSVQSRTGDAESHALQERIERKRQDDLVRRKEFNHLRKLRTGMAASGATAAERGTGFQVSSGFGPDERAATIKKIDAIETHMVKGWAKSKSPVQRPQPIERAATPVPPALPPTPTPTPTAKAAPPPAKPSPDFLDSMNLAFMASLGKPKPDAAASTATDLTPPQRNATPAPKIPIVRLPVVAPEPLPEAIEAGLQEAALVFAEGDFGAAEAILLGMLQVDGVAPGSADALASALFHLYRATGQQDGFDVVAMDYAERFGSSPGEWFSISERLNTAAGVEPVAAVVVAVPLMMQVQDPDAAWICPAVLDDVALAKLKARFPGAKAEWYVDWGMLGRIEPQAITSFASLVDHWSSQPVDLHWSEVDSLLEALEACTPPDDNTTDPKWWLIRMDVMCILNQQDPFESLALDYCVIYEVSPPSWKPARCKLIKEVAQSAFAALADDPLSVMPADWAVSTEQGASCELNGELTGDAASAIEGLVAATGTARSVVVSCALLMRADFAATGVILNWAAACEAEGCEVKFVQVPRLVAVFFKMLGVDQHAQILVRTN